MKKYISVYLLFFFLSQLRAQGLIINSDSSILNYSLSSTSPIPRIGSSIIELMTAPKLLEPRGVPVEWCQLSDSGDMREIELGSKIPEYFFKTLMPTSPDDKRNEVSIIIGETGNALLDLNTGIIKNIPGAFDAVPSIDGEIITLPSHKKTDNRFTIYHRNNLETPIFQERDDDPGRLIGVYQSVGLLKKGEGNKVYRVITDVLTPSNTNGDTSTLRGKNLLFRDYKIEANKDVTPLEAAKPLCANIDETLKLPMISKDGKKLSAYNNRTGTTMIYQIFETNNQESHCKLEVDLGFASTKVEFSEDSKMITFASDSFATVHNAIRWHAQPKPIEMNMNVFAMDLQSRRVKKISNVNAGNAYYPSFSRDNTITYLKQNKTDKGEEYSVVQTKFSFEDEQTLNDRPYVDGGCLTSKDSVALMALGKLWFEMCSKVNLKPTRLAAQQTALQLDPKNCRSLVEKYWEEVRDNQTIERVIAKDQGTNEVDMSQQNQLSTEELFESMRLLKAEDLMSFCPTAPKKEVKVEKLKVQASNLVKDTDVLSARCSACHVEGAGRKFVIGNNKSMKQNKDLAIKHVKSGYMPLGIKLNEDEKIEIIKQLSSIR